MRRLLSITLKVSLLAVLCLGWRAQAQNTDPEPPVCTDLSGKFPEPCPEEPPAPVTSAVQKGKHKQVAAPKPMEDEAEPDSEAAAPESPATAVSTNKAADAGKAAASKTVSTGRGTAPQPVTASYGKSTSVTDTSPAEPEESPEIVQDADEKQTDNTSLRVIPSHLFRDQQRFWLSPLRIQASDSGWIVPFGIGTAVLIGSDTRIERSLPTGTSTINNADKFSNYMAYAMGGMTGAAYVFGRLNHNDHLSETGMLAGEAAVTSLAPVFLVKTLAGRDRPMEGDGKGRFRQGGQSFPSEHAAAAWSIASVVANEYPSPFVGLLAYGSAGAISAARVVARQHFTSDVVIGGALGWFVGRQIYRASRENQAERNRWGMFVRNTGGDKERDPRYMGSAYVPLDSWIYPAFDRLAALGYMQSGFAGLRPWTRMECARLVDEIGRIVPEGEGRSEAQLLYSKLQIEFDDETGRREGDRNQDAVMESVYSRVVNISGKPLTDGYHFGQTINNDFGRPYGEGTNAISGFAARTAAGPFAFYYRGEYQHAPSNPAEPLAAREAEATLDLVPVAPDTLTPARDRLRTIEAYVALNVHNYQFSFGKQSLWWGPGEGGPMMMSNNAEPITMLRINRVEPVKLPSLLGWLGPMRTEVFVGQLSGYRFISDIGSYNSFLDPQPYIFGQKISFKPTPNFEFGFSRTNLFSGPDSPFTLHKLIKVVGVSNPSDNGRPRLGPDDPGDRRSGFDFSYRIPGLRNYLQLYADGFTDDELSPVAYPRRAGWHPGIYIPQFPYLRKLDFRAEGETTPTVFGFPGFFYYNVTYRGGYTNNGELLGNWVGRQGTGWQGWSTYWFSPISTLQVNYRDAQVDKELLGGGRLHDYGVQANVQIRPDLILSGGLQYEHWNFPLLWATPQSNVVTSFQLKFSPQWKMK